MGAVILFLVKSIFIIVLCFDLGMESILEFGCSDLLCAFV